jgi:hypothetical protein
MTTNWSGLWAPRRPPKRIVEAARRAFDERSGPGTRPVELVFDSLADAEWTPSDMTRILMFSGDGLAILLTSTRCAEGNRVGGAVFTRTPVTLALRQPMRATIAIPTTDDGRLLPTTVVTGPASVFARASAPATGRTWQSEWLTL